MKNCNFLEKVFFLLATGITLFTMQACEEKEEPVLLPNVDREDMMEAIDLGLPSGTLWASCNLGASSPEEYGDYFAWGETDVNYGYSWQTYQWCSGTYESMSTDCVDSVELNLQYDAAFAKWGDQWRMPTVADFKELATKCTWTWTIQNGVKGYLVTGSNENSIFLPAAGCRRDGTILHGGYTGCYWSTTLYESDAQHAHLLYFDDDSYSYKFRNFRVDGRSVRAITGGGNVSDESEENADKPSEDNEFNLDYYTGIEQGHKYVDLGLSSKILWATCNVGANSPDERGNFYAWGETEEYSDYTPLTYKYYLGDLDNDGDYNDDSNEYMNIGSNISGTQYDVAHVIWGGNWRMPTKDELAELWMRCKSELKTYNNVKGYLFTGPNGNSVFLPVTGYKSGIDVYDSTSCYYSSARLRANFNDDSYNFYATTTSPASYFPGNSGHRFLGLVVRPVIGTLPDESIKIVDLGLSVKWADRNVGANYPEEYGGYYAWGEIEEKSEYSKETYRYYDSNMGYMNIGTNISGTQYDVAYVKWGNNWRMPTQDELNELCNKCSWEYSTYNGVEGQLVTGPNGNSIFLPNAGLNKQMVGSMGYYWSATLSEYDNSGATGIIFDTEIYKTEPWTDYRYAGYAIRPVCK